MFKAKRNEAVRSLPPKARLNISLAACELIHYGEQSLSVNSITKDHESRAQGMVIIKYFLINNTSYNLNANNSFLFFLSFLVNHIISCDLDDHLYSM